MFSSEFCKIFKNTDFEELSANGYIVTYFMKINHLIGAVIRKDSSNVSVCFGVIVPEKICTCSKYLNKTLIFQALRFHVICIDQSNFKFCVIEL